MTKEEFASLFEETQYAGDFEAVLDVPKWMARPDSPDSNLWLKAYDTSVGESDHEKTASGLGFKFECYAWFRVDNKRQEQLLHFLARTEDDAIDMFWNYYNQLYMEEEK